MKYKNNAMKDTSMNQSLQKFRKRFARYFMVALLFMFAMNSYALDSTDYLNEATVTASAAQNETITNNNDDDAQVTPNSATLTIRKIWVDATVGDEVNITSTSTVTLTNTTTGNGSVDNTVDFTSTADTANEATDTTGSTTYEVFAGATQTFLESFTIGTAGNYNTELACTGNTNALTYTSGSLTGSLVIDEADTAIVCTYTNSQTADVSITKVLDTTGPYVLGQAVSYTITVSNGGPSEATNVEVSDTPVNLSGVTFTGACTAMPCTIASIASGATSVTTVSGTITADGAFSNTAAITALDQTDSDVTGVNTQTATDNTTPTADVSITKVLDTTGPYVLGQAVSYTITVSNGGPSEATNVEVSDTPVNLSGVTFTGACTAMPCTIASIASGATSVTTVSGTITADGAFSNTATIDALDQTDSDVTGVNTQTATDNTTPTADVSITKVLDTTGPYVLGQAVSYTITVSNGGPSEATNVEVSDTPTNLSGVTFTGACTAMPCTIASIASGATSVTTVSGTITADGAFSNTAAITALDQTDSDVTGVNTSTATDNTTPTADVSITKVLDTTGPYVLGQAVSYTITVSNGGPSEATNVEVSDTPTNLSGVTFTGGCTAMPCTIASIASGATSVTTVSGTITADGAFSNTAAITALDQTDSDVTGVNTQTATDNTTPTADVSITKVLDTTGPYVLGQAVSYTITVSNGGPSEATNVEVSDTPVNLSGVTFTGGCTAMPCTIASIASGATSVTTVSGTITADGAFSNTATIDALDQTDSDVTGVNTQTATDNTTPTADVSITKVLDTTGPYVLGQAVSYTITVSNGGPSEATNVEVSDTPTNLSGVTFTGACTAMPCTIASIASGATSVTTVSGTITADGAFSNTAAITALDQTDSDVTGVNTSTATDNTTPTADVSITKVLDTTGPYVLGQAVSYTITVSNGGPSEATNVEVSDTPTNLSGVTFTGGCTAMPCTIASIASGATSVTTVNGTITADGAFSNTAAITALDQTDSDVTGVNTSTATDNTTPTADVSITKVLDTTGPYVLGQAVSYTITVSNGGPSEATNVEVSDTPTNLSGVTFTGACTAMPCTIASIASGATSVTTVSGTITADGAFSNTAAITALDQTDSDVTGVNTSTATDNTTPTADVSITKVLDTTGPYVLGQAVSYTITVSNGGPSEATNVEVSDTPVNLSGVTFTGGCTAMPCTIASIASGATSVTTVSGTITADGAFSNTAAITALDQTDSDVTGVNTSTATDNTTPTADVSITKVLDTTGPYVLGQAVSYTITVSNGGPSEATNVEVSDTPTNLSGVTFTGACTAMPCTIASIASGATSVTTVSGTITADGAFSNTAAITALDQTDSDVTGVNTSTATDNTTPTADVSITKVLDTTGPYVLGQAVSYTITVSNGGPSEATNVEVSDTPTNLSGVTFTGACTAMPCTIASIASGATSVTTVSGTITADGAFSNTAAITALDQTDSDVTGVNTSTATDNTTPTADVSITKVLDTTGPYVLGQAVSYTITVSNGGPSEATNVEVSDTPTNLSGVTFTGACTAMPCTIASIASGATSVTTVNGTITADGAFSNTATIDALDQTDSDVTGVNTSTATDNTTPTADVSITKVLDTTGPYVLGQAVSYTITVSNGGPSEATNVEVSDTPTNLSGVTFTGGCTAMPCTIASIASGATSVTTVSGTITADGAFSNTAAITALDQTDSDVTGVNTSTATDNTTPTADVSITKVLDTTGPYVLGQAVSYTITVSNGGPSEATNVEVSDTPVNLSGVTFTGGCTAMPCTIASIASGATSVTTVSGTITADGAFSNTATIDALDQTDSDVTGVNTSTATDNTTPTADVSITKVLDTTGPYVLGQAVSYTITVSNGGPSEATNVEVSDTPVNLSGVTFTGGCTAMPCTIASIASGATSVTTVSGTITADGAFSNTATIDALDQTDSDVTGVNTSTATDNTTPTADVSITKVLDTTGPYVLGQAVSYTITVSNGGPSEATNVEVSDTPVNLSGVTFTGGCTAMPCTIASIASGATSVTTVSGTITADGAFSNTATIDALDQTDSDVTGVNTSTATNNTTPISFTVGDVTVNEDVGNASVPVTLSAVSAVDTVVSITTTDNSAEDPADYTTTTTTVTIPAGQTTVNVAIPVIDDTTGEPTENFTVNGEVTSGNTSNTTDTGTVTITDNDTPAMTVGDVTIAEDGGSASVPVSIDNPSSVDTVVTITTTDNSAADPADYTTTTTTVTIPAGQTTVNVAIPVIDDTTGEPTENFTVNGEVTSGNTSNTTDTGTVTITDNDTPAMTVGDVTIAEDGGSASVPVSIDNPSSVDTVVTITTTDNSAADPADYTTTTTTVTIPAGQTTVNVAIPVIDDTTGEPTENFTVNGEVTSGNTSNTTDTGTVTITDNDTPAMTVGDVTIAEDGGSASVPVSIDNPSSVDTVVTITTTDNSAADPADYTTTTTTVTIPAGQTTVNVAIPVIDDTTGEPTENFTVNGEVTSGNTSNTTDTGTVTITDNDTPAMTVGDVTIAEDGGSASVPVSIDNPSSVDTVVTITTTDNSAADPADYTTTTTTVTIPAGQTTVNVAIPVIDDTTGEPTENFTVNGEVTSGNTSNTTDTGTVTITDNDTPAMTVGDVTIAEDGGSASVPVSIDNPSSVDTVVTITTTDNSAEDPADYTTTTTTVTIPAGQTTVNVAIPVIDDTTGEPTENFTVNGEVTSGNTSNTTDTGTVTITDNDTPAMTVGDVTIAEDGGSASVPVSIDNPSSVDTVVTITTTDNSAEDPADYTTTTTTVTIPAGQTTVNVAIPVIDDTTGEPTENFTVNGEVTSGNTSNTTDTGTVTITDNDTPAMTVGDVTIAEDGGSASVPVSIDNPSSVDTVVTITTTDNSAEDPADYTTTTTTVTIPAGQTTVNVAIPVIDDTTGEPTENFTVNGEVTSGNTSNTTDTGTVRITDNDTPAMTVGDVTIAEDGGSASVPVSIDNPSSVDTVVTITTTDNSAADPADYTTTTTTVTIPAGQTTVNVAIPVIDDTTGEPTENFTVNGEVTSGNTSNTTDTGTVTITDNDTPAMTVGDVTIAEDGGSASVPVSIDNPSSVDTVVTITTTDNSAADPADYTTTTTTVTIPAGQTTVNVAIPVIDDTTGEPTENFTVNGEVTSGNTSNTTDTGTVTITDNDTPAMTVGDVTIAEDGGSASVPVSIDNPSSVDTVVTITTTDNSAADPADYTTTTTTVTIPAGQTTVNVAIPVIDDTTGEPTENFTVNGEVTSGNTSNTTDTGTVTITDNDTPAMTVGDVTIAEDGGSASVPVSIDNPSSVDTVVTITTTDNSAEDPADYTTTTTTVTIPAGQTTVNVAIPVIDDTTGEPTENFTVNGEVTSGNTSNTTDTGTVTITDNDTPAMTVGDVTIAEDGGSASVPVSIDNPSSVDTVVTITTTDNSAEDPADYTTTTTTVTIPAGQTTVNVAIPVIDDTTGEPTENFTVNGEVTSGNTSNTTDTGTVTITDNDTPAMTVGDVTIAEDGGSASVPVSIDNPSSVDTVVTITTTDNSAADPADYTTTTTTVTIPAGQTTVNVAIPVIDDTTGEPTENFTVNGEVTSGNTSNTTDTGTVTITDNDTPAMTVGDVTIAEDGGSASVPVSIDNPSSVDTVVTITTTDNSAADPADYTTTTTTVTIPAGQTTVNVAIPVIDDTTGEPTENFTVNGEVTSGNTSNTTDTGTVTITDNDTPAMTVGDVTIAEDGGSASVPVSIDNPSSVDTVVTITTTDNSAEDPADYTTTTTTVTIPAGQTTVNVAIPVIDDTTGEPTENFTVNGEVTSGNTSNTTDTGTVTITDNDTPAMTVGDVTIAEDGGSASVPVSIDNPSSVDTVVTITTTDNSAEDPADYTTTTTTVTIPAGQTTVNVAIPVIDDTTGEPTENFTVNGEVTSGNTSNTTDTGTVTITDNDTPAMTVGDVTIAEDGGSASVPVSIDNPSSVDTVVTITTTDNSAEDPADYTTTTTTVTIPAGQTTVNVAIPVIDDTTGEPTENFTVNGEVTSGNTSNTTDTGTVTITDNDTPAMTVGDVTIAEDGGSASVPVSIDNPSSVDTVVTITTTDNSAADPADYTTTTTTVTIPAGQTTVNVAIPVIDDTTGEPTENFTVNGEVTSGNTSNTTDTGTVTITDNDTPAMTVGDVTIAEDGGSASVPVSIDNPSSVDTVVTITTTDNSAEDPADYTTTTTTVTIPAGQTTVNVAIPVIDDTTGEPTENFTVNGEVTSGNTSNTTDSGTVTITDNDIVSIMIGNLTVPEDVGTAIVPVTLSTPSSVDTVIDIVTATGTAGTDDYTETTTTVTIPAGQTSVDVVIPVTDDSIDEPNENFNVNGTVTSGNTANTDPSGEVTITDNDAAPTVTIGDVTTPEDSGTVTVPVTIDVVSSVDTVIDIVTSTGTAGTDDYTETTITVTIPAGQTSVDVVIPVTDDSTDEPNENFNVNGTVTSGNTANTDPSGEVTIEDNDAAPTVIIGDVTTPEDSGTVTVPVTIDVVSSVDTVIDIVTSTGTAGTDDYTETTTTVTIPAGQTSVDVVIPVTDDSIDEPNENFNVNGTVTSGNTANTDPSGEVTIEDNDAAPTVIIGDVTTPEDSGTVTVPVTIDVLSSVDTVIDIVTSTGTAGTDDYTETTTTVTIPAGQTSVDVVIPVTDDSTDEPNENFTVNGTVTSGNTANTDPSGTVTIIDNDVALIEAVDVTSADPVNGTTGGTIPENVLTNDTLNGTPVNPADVTLVPVTEGPLTVNADGTVTVAPNTPAGPYTATYEICEVLNPTNCDSATITVVVEAAPIDAVDVVAADPVSGVSGGTIPENVLTNDTLNGNPVVPADVTLDPVTDGPLTVNADGSVTVAPNTPVGSYTVTYEICEVLNPTNCDTAMVTVPVVVNLPPVAVDDSSEPNQPLGQPVTINTVSNDSDPEGNLDPISVLIQDASGNPVTTLVVDGEGTWTVDPTTGDITFTPVADFLGDPTPINYTVKDTTGLESNVASVTIDYEEPASIQGTVWLDRDKDGTIDSNEDRKAGWTLNIKDTNGNVVATTITDAQGNYSVTGLIPDEYTVEFLNTNGTLIATQSTDGPLVSGQTLDLPLPVDPSGVVYDSTSRDVIAGVTLELLNSQGTRVDTSCLGAGQQSQVTTGDGIYAFDVYPDAHSSCPNGETYTIRVVSVPTGYNTSSTNIPSQTGAYDSAANETNCTRDVIPNSNSCEVQGQPDAPQGNQDTTYYMDFTLSLGDNNVIFNHIPLDIDVPNTDLDDNAVLLSKSVNKKQISVGDQLYYTIRAENTTDDDFDIDVRDDLPTGFKLLANEVKLTRAGADRRFGTADDTVSTVNANGSDPVLFGPISLTDKEIVQIGYLIKVGTAVQQGSAINKAQAFGSGTNTDIASNVATATVQIVADKVLDQSTLIGKVFHDRDGDGYQDPANVTGITVKSDYFGWNSLHLGGLNARVSELDDPAKYRKVIRMPWGKKNDFKVTTQQGTIITVDNRGQLTESHVGLKAKGLTAQDIRLTTKRTKGIPSQTPVVAMRKPAKVMDVLEISITNYGIQEEGIPGVRLATVEGLLIETDGYGRYHIPDVDGGRRSVGKNFIIKVDTATLPDGARFTTENPRVLRLTGAALNKINFGVKLPIQASPYRVEYQAAKYRNETVRKTHTRKVPVYKSVDVNLGSIFFDKDKHHIRTDQRGVMDDIANKIKQYGHGHITIDAFTDSRHHAQYNILLAKRRAHSVRTHLMKRLGHNLMKNVKVEVDPKALKEVPHNDPRAIDFKGSK